MWLAGSSFELDGAEVKCLHALSISNSTMDAFLHARWRAVSWQLMSVLESAWLELCIVYRTRGASPNLLDLGKM